MRSFFNMLWSWLKEAFLKLIGKDEPQQTDPSEPDNEYPGFDRPDRPGPGEIICYYGCPNSKTAAKLQLSKKLYR